MIGVDSNNVEEHSVMSSLFAGTAVRCESVAVATKTKRDPTGKTHGLISTENRHHCNGTNGSGWSGRQAAGRPRLASPTHPPTVRTVIMQWVGEGGTRHKWTTTHIHIIMSLVIIIIICRLAKCIWRRHAPYDNITIRDGPEGYIMRQ